MSSNYSCYKKDSSANNNCNAILRKFHLLMDEAEQLYEECDEIIDKQAVNSIYNAIIELERVPTTRLLNPILDYIRYKFSSCSYQL